MPTYRQIFKSTGLLGSVQALYIAIAVVRNKVAALLIGVTGMGLADIFARSLELVGNATNFGFSLSAVKQLAPKLALASQNPEKWQTLREEANKQVAIVRTWVILTALLGLVVGASFSPLLSRWFTDSDQHTIDFLMLSPAIAFATLTGGEMAILKAEHRLKSIAYATSMGAFTTFLYCTLFYYFWGIKGIVPMLVFSAGTLFFLTLQKSCKTFRYRFSSFNKKFFDLGKPLLRLGSAYILAGVMASVAEMLIRVSFIHSDGGLTAVGLYAVGFTLVVSYARLIFAAVDADYFPRLTAALENQREMDVTIDKQINTLIVLMVPFLIAFSLALPLVIRILYTKDFLTVVPMITVALPSMYLKAIYTPIAYLPLAKGDSVLYMVMELAYNVVFCSLVIGGWHWAGLVGAGLGFTLANLCDMIAVQTIYSHRYGYRMSVGTSWRRIVLAIPLFIGLWATTLSSISLRLTIGLLALLLTLPPVWPILKDLKKKKK